MSCWAAERMFTQYFPDFIKRSLAVLSFLIEMRTSGGSRETEMNADTVSPKSSPVSRALVTTVTAEGKYLITFLRSIGVLTCFLGGRTPSIMLSTLSPSFSPSSAFGISPACSSFLELGEGCFERTFYIFLYFPAKSLFRLLVACALHELVIIKEANS